MSKGSRVRPHNKEKFDKNYNLVFGEKRLNVWRGAPLKEDSDGIQGNTGNGTRDQSDSGRPTGVPKEPGGQPDSPVTGPVEPTQDRDWRGKHPLDTDYWTYSGRRGEYTCPHGVGHGDHIHGCCEESCCQRDDFPLRSKKR